jgi:peptide chain release factor 2
LPAGEKELAALDERMAKPGFWDNPEESKKTLSRLKELKARIEPMKKALGKLADVRELLELARMEGDQKVEEEVARDIDALRRETEALETANQLSGKNDPLDCYLSIHAGAGGTDSADWAEMLLRMLLRMYARWSERRGYKTVLLDSLPNDEAGIKHAVLSIKGPFAYGNLQSEIGVHRLVRISRFDFNERRHTSFASVDVLPEFEEEPDIEILDRDIKMEAFRAGGPGGQHVNVTSSAVRITHIPTGIIVQCQNERSQHRNRAEAMKMLKTKLLRLKELEQAKETQHLYSEKGEIAWGSQIRSYVLHPYQMVKDHRTEEETSDTEGVLDGEIDRFIRAYLRTKKK